MSRPKASGGLLRAGLAGCGAIGSGYDEGRAGRQVYTHAGMYSRLPMFELAAMADPDPERFARAGGCWGTRGLYPGVEGMLREEELDVLSVATPDRTHPEVLECVLVRSDGQAVAVNLDIEPAEPPEDVPWIDPTHPA